MKIVKKFIGILLSIVIIMGNMSFINLVKADTDNVGYIYIYYRDISDPTNEDIHSLETKPIPLDENGNGTGVVEVIGISGYIYQYALVNEVKKINKEISIPVTSENTVDNPVKVYIYYKQQATVKTVATYGMYLHEDGSTEPFSDTYQSVTVPEGSSSTINTVAPAPLNPSYKFLYATVGENGEHISSNTVQVTVTDSDISVYYWYATSSLGAGTVRVTTGDHILENGQVVNEADGKDYFAREDIDYNVDDSGYLQVNVKSPSMGASKPDYEFAFALVEHSGGNPNNALSNYIEKKTALQFDTTIDTSSTMWYVHFYWVKKGDIPPDPENPDSGKIVFNPNETSWTFDSNKKPGWSNAGKIENGTGDYPVNAKFQGDNPKMGKGTVTYTYQLEHTGTTGNPPHEYTYWTDESYSEDFDVSYYLKNMSISGDDAPNPTNFDFPDLGQGTSFPTYDANGDVHIKKEGVSLGLKGTSTWYDLVRDRDYKVPEFHAAGTTRNVEEHLKLPDPPANPTGSSSTYKLDWTNPEIYFSVEPGIFSTNRNAVRKESQKGEGDSFYGTLTFRDNLSGCKSLEYGWTFGDNPSKADYKTLYTMGYTSDDRSAQVLKREVEKPVGDDLYLHVKLVDMAGNETDKTFGPYEDPIKLKNFRVIDVTDPTWENLFWKDGTDYITKKTDERPALKQPTNKEFKVNKLPLDNKSNPYDTYIKKGYAFYFKVDSEYLYRDYDRIEISPTFYYWDKENNKRVQVDAYYNKNNNPFTKVGSDQDTFKINTYASSISPHHAVEIGGYNKLTLTKEVRDFKGRPFYDGWKDEIQYVDGKEQYWYGQYYLPDTTIFAEKGKSPRPENVLKKNYIIINFQIKAYKNGQETNSNDQVFTYVPRQWTKEKGPKNSSYKLGDVIVYDNKKAVFNNFGSYITN
jgi:hypothetical protein